MKQNEKLLSGTANDCYEDAVRCVLVHRFADARDLRARAGLAARAVSSELSHGEGGLEDS
jgi:hypothetical protein